LQHLLDKIDGLDSQLADLKAGDGSKSWWGQRNKLKELFVADNLPQMTQKLLGVKVDLASSGRRAEKRKKGRGEIS
jgi:hypothetical protein